MKSISEFIGTLCILYIFGMVVYGGIKEGHTGKIILFFGGVFFIIYLFNLREENRAKIEQLEKEKLKLEKFNEELERFKYKIYAFAYGNERINKIIYDIEEGGQYIAEYDKTVRKKIDNIIKQYIQFPNNNFELYLPKIQESILELPKQSKNKYIGF